MKRLSGVDAMLLYSETAEIHMHTIKVAVVDLSALPGGLPFPQLKEAAYRVLLGLEPLRYRLVSTPGHYHHPMWQENAPIDADYHIRRAVVAPPGGRRELDQLIGALAAVPLQRDRPLWELHIAEGLADNRIAVILKLHHALADGVASANLIAKALREYESLLLADTADRPDPIPATGRLVEGATREHLRQLANLPPLIWRTGAGAGRVWRRSRRRRKSHAPRRPALPPPSFANHVVSPGRRFATASLPLSEVVLISRQLGVTINDVVLAIAAGALRTLQLRYGGSVDKPLLAGVPASFNKSPERLSGNEFGYMIPPLPIHIADPLERVSLTSAAAAVAKENFALRGPTLMAEWLAYLPPRFSPAMFRWQSRRLSSGSVMNLTISNVPGPRTTHTLSGARITEIHSVGPLAAGSALNITVWSYVDQLNVSVLTDDVTMDDPHEATQAMTDSFNEIRTAVLTSDDSPGAPLAPAAGD